MNNLIVGKSQLVEAPIVGTPAAGMQVFFNDIANISKGNIKLYGIEAFSFDQCEVAPSGLAVVSAGDVPNITVTLVTNKEEKIMEDMPYYNLITSLNAGFIKLLNNYRIDLTKCYFTINAPGGLAEDEVGLFMLYYDLV